MNPASVLGSLGTLIGLVRALPQLRKLLSAREANGVSVDSAANSCIVSFGWAVYGVLTGQPYVSLATGSSGMIFFMTTVFALRYGRKIKEFVVAPVWLCLIALAGFFAGHNGLGAVLPVSVLAANLPQLWVAYKEGNLEELSLGTWLLSISDGLIWGAYALLQQDMSIIVFAFLQLITSGLIVTLKLTNMKRLRLQRKAGIGVQRFKSFHNRRI